MRLLDLGNGLLGYYLSWSLTKPSDQKNLGLRHEHSNTTLKNSLPSILSPFIFITHLLHLSAFQLAMAARRM